MTKIISFISGFSGAGKTTTIVNLSSWLALLGKKVLVLDFAEKNDLSSNLGLNEVNSVGCKLNDVLLENIPLEQSIILSSVKDLYFSFFDYQVTPDFFQELFANDLFVLSEVIDLLEQKFDFIFIDTSVAINNLLLATLVASDSVILPVKCSAKELSEIGLMADIVLEVKNNYNRWLELEGILLTSYNDLESSREIVNQARSRFGNMLFKTLIPRNMTIESAAKLKLPIVLHDLKSFGAEAYLRLAREFLKNN